MFIKKKNYFKGRSSHWRCSVKKVFFEEALAQVLSCEFCKISKNKHFWLSTSVKGKQNGKYKKRKFKNMVRRSD